MSERKWTKEEIEKSEEGKKVTFLQDGSAWFCLGEGFQDLQSSDNYGLGDSMEEAFEDYLFNMNTSPFAHKDTRADV